MNVVGKQINDKVEALKSMNCFNVFFIEIKNINPYSLIPLAILVETITYSLNEVILDEGEIPKYLYISKIH